MTSIAQLQQTARTLKLLNEKFTPYPAQIRVGQDVFYNDVKRLFLSFGRRSGKSTLLAAIAVRWAVLNPGSQVWIIGPLLNQIREVFLHSGIIERVIPEELLESYNQTEGRFRFTNDSFIRVLGANDQKDKIRGIRASLVLADEVKDIDPEVFDILTPALMDENGVMILSGTPPEVPEHFFWDMVETAKKDPAWRYHHSPTHDNPHINQEAVEKERLRMLASGDYDIYIREYLAEYAPGSKRAVFPMLSNDDHVQPYDEMRQNIYKNVTHWDFRTAMDPGTASCFAGLVAAINPYKRIVYLMDEAYVTTQADISIGRVWPLIAAKQREVFDPDKGDADQWDNVVDEAALWGRQELLDQFGLTTWATKKAENKKADGISLIKDLLLKQHRLVISDRCVNLLKEMRGYLLDKQGNYVKRNDHLIDCLRYLLHFAGITLEDGEAPPEPEVIPEDERRRAFTPMDDYLAANGGEREMYLMDYINAEED